jgi:hypothetical protein
MNSGGYGSSAAPRLPLFLCSEVNFRQMMFSEIQSVQGIVKRAECKCSALFV